MPMPRAVVRFLVASGAAGALSGLVSFGADGAGDVTLTADFTLLNAQGLSSGGEVLVYSVVGDTLTATAGVGGPTVFTLVVGTDGSYDFTLSGPLDHPVADGDDGELLAGMGIDFSGVLAATDGDGDPLVGGFPAGSFVINVEDDVPVVDSNATVLLDDDALAGGNPGGVGDEADAANVSGTLAHSYGADGGSMQWLTTGAPAGFSYELSGGALLVKQGTTTVMTVTLDSVTGAYTVTQNALIAHAAGLDENNASFNLTYRVTDGDNDTADGTLTIHVDDDTPTVGSNATVLLDDDALAGGIPGGVGDDADAANVSGTLAHSYGADGGSMQWLTSGAPDGFSYELSGGALLVKQGTTTVMTVTLDSVTGAYTVTQKRAHPARGRAG